MHVLSAWRARPMIAAKSSPFYRRISNKGTTSLLKRRRLCSRYGRASLDYDPALRVLSFIGRLWHWFYIICREVLLHSLQSELLPVPSRSNWRSQFEFRCNWETSRPHFWGNENIPNTCFFFILNEISIIWGRSWEPPIGRLATAWALCGSLGSRPREE